MTTLKEFECRETRGEEGGAHGRRISGESDEWPLPTNWKAYCENRGTEGLYTHFATASTYYLTPSLKSFLICWLLASALLGCLLENWNFVYGGPIKAFTQWLLKPVNAAKMQNICTDGDANSWQKLGETKFWQDFGGTSK